jgi:hypothetical protein
MLRTRTWPWLVLAVVLLVVHYLIHEGIPRSILGAAAVFVFLGACIRLVGFMVRDNPTSAEMVTRRSIEAGTSAMLADESSRKRQQRAAAKRADAPDSPER